MTWYVHDFILVMLNLIIEQLPKMNRYPQPRSILIMDNCPTHKSEALQLVVEAAGRLFALVRCLYADVFQDVFSCSFPHTRLISTQ